MWLCDEIRRDEDPSYVQHHLEWEMLGFVPREKFSGARVLDFGCGSGASTMILARLLPDAKIAGVELVPEFVELARHRAAFYGVERQVEFHRSNNALDLPAGIGQFDYVVMSAVYEHLLPAERRSLLPALWRALKPGGVLFLNGTPHRWFPVEQHTTGFPLLNYLPRPLVHWITCRYCGRVGRNESWNDLLRRGIRGATQREVLRVVAAGGTPGFALTPCREGIHDEIDLWLAMSGSLRRRGAKQWFAHLARGLKAVTGLSLTPCIAMAIQKPR